MAGPFPSEIWHSIAADFIISSTTLQSLCLVSRTLNMIFTPHFFAQVVLHEKHQYSGVTELPLQRLADLSEERCLVFIKRLELPRMLHREEHWAALGRLLNKATGLRDCSISCEPGDMVKFDYPGIAINDVRVSYNVGSRFPDAEIHWRRMPIYKNLRHLDLYSMSRKVNMGAQIARVLADSPGLKSLGLGQNQLAQLSGGSSYDLLTQIANEFESCCEPGMRLEIEDLKLGYRASNRYAYGYESDALSRLTDLSKLQRLSHFNQSRPGERGEERYVADLNEEILLGARNLRSVSAHFCTKGLVLLVNELSQKQPRTLQEVKIHTIDSKWGRSQSFQPLENLGGGWRRIHVGGTTSVKTYEARDDVYNTFVAQSYDSIEDFGIYAAWEVRILALQDPFGVTAQLWTFINLKRQHILEKEITKYTNLRRLFVVQVAGMFSTHAVKTREIRIVKQLFNHHRTEMKKKGLDSKLKYIGIGIDRTVYTFMWPTGKISDTSAEGLTRDLDRLSTSQIELDGYQIIALSREEAETFDAFVPGQL